jgi:transcriptional regulator of heat shock response
MVLTKEELKRRRDFILAIAIDEYIKSVTPVSSSFIAKRYPGNVSSATVRNILAELETEGFLTHPHTSAGRIPTEAGYRYYVDNLMSEIQLLEVEKSRIKTEYQRQRMELESLLDQTSRALSKATEYTSIISIDGYDDKLICTGTSYVAKYPDYRDLAKIHNILYALEEKEQLLKVINKELVDKIEIIIGHEIALTEMDECSIVVSNYAIKNGPTGRMAVLGPTRMRYDRVISAIGYIREMIKDFEI